MSVDNEKGGLKVQARVRAKPSDNGHAAIVAVLIDKMPTLQIMVKVDLVPWFAKRSDAIGSRRDPDCARVLTEELDSTLRIVVKEEDTEPDAHIYLETIGG
jgi:hypothetical protein